MKIMVLFVQFNVTKVGPVDTLETLYSTDNSNASVRTIKTRLISTRLTCSPAVMR